MMYGMNQIMGAAKSLGNKANAVMLECSICRLAQVFGLHNL